jgi:hypothetical protein
MELDGMLIDMPSVEDMDIKSCFLPNLLLFVITENTMSHKSSSTSWLGCPSLLVSLWMVDDTRMISLYYLLVDFIV